MRLSLERLQAEVEATGFRAELLEKTIHLLSLLDALRAHPYLGAGRWALKGGTALNVFDVFDVLRGGLPRLSVDADLNYVGAVDRETAQAERPRVEQALRDMCTREGFTIVRTATEHAGGKWRLRYASALGSTGGGNVEVDLNYILRTPLWGVEPCDSVPVGSFGASRIPVLERHELAGGKLAALLSRHASRDLFDAHRLLTLPEAAQLDRARLRLAFVVYGGINRKDWRTVSPDDVAFTQQELEDQLVPVLRVAEARKIQRDPDWAPRLVRECRAALAVVLPLIGSGI